MDPIEDVVITENISCFGTSSYIEAKFTVKDSLVGLRAIMKHTLVNV